MRFTLSLFLFFYGFCSCSPKRENTYEQNLAACTKRLGHFPKGIDSTSTIGANAKAQFQEQIRDCMQGSTGPKLMVKTYTGDSVSTVPTQGKAMVLFFWLALPDDAPIEFKKSDKSLFTAMNMLHRKYTHSVEFLGFPFNDIATAKQYLQAHPLDFPQVQDKKISSDKHILLSQNSNPYLIFINSKGKVVKIITGSLSTEKRAIEVYSPIIQACIKNKPLVE